MKPFNHFCRPAGRVLLFVSVIAVFSTGATLVSRTIRAAGAQGSTGRDDAALIESFRRVEVASVSDAMEQILGKKLYMMHQMRPIFRSKFAGFALTVHLRKEE